MKIDEIKKTTSMKVIEESGYQNEEEDEEHEREKGPRGGSEFDKESGSGDQELGGDEILKRFANSRFFGKRKREQIEYL